MGPPWRPDRCFWRGGESAATLVGVDSTYLYWSTTTALRRIPTAGGTPSTVSTVSLQQYNVSLDTSNPGGTALVWTSGPFGQAQLLTAPIATLLANGTPTVLASQSMGGLAGNPSGPSADATSVFFFMGSGSQMQRTSSVAMVAKRPPGSMVVDLTDGGGPGNLGGPQLALVDSTSVYWTNDQGIWQVPKGGGVPPALVVSGGSLGVNGGLAADATNVYYSDQVSGSVVRVDKSTLSAVQLAVAQSPYAVATDGQNVYWSNAGAGGISRIASCSTSVPCGATPRIVVDGTLVASMLVDAVNVYWAGQGAVWELAK